MAEMKSLMHIQECPITAAVHMASVNGKFHIFLQIEHPNGSSVFLMTGEMAKAIGAELVRLGNQLASESSTNRLLIPDLTVDKNFNPKGE